MIIIIILTASYIGDDVRIVYALVTYDVIFFGDGQTDQREQGGSRSRIGYILPTIGKYMLVEFIYWYWIYSANNWEIYVSSIYILVKHVLIDPHSKCQICVTSRSRFLCK